MFRRRAQMFMIAWFQMRCFCKRKSKYSKVWHERYNSVFSLSLIPIYLISARVKITASAPSQYTRDQEVLSSRQYQYQFTFHQLLRQCKSMYTQQGGMAKNN